MAPAKSDLASDVLGRYKPLVNVSAVAAIIVFMGWFIHHNFQSQDNDRAMFEKQIEYLRADSKSDLMKLLEVHQRTEATAKDILHETQENGKTMREMIEWCKKAAGRSGVMGPPPADEKGNGSGS